jgi:heat shock protein HtpX
MLNREEIAGVMSHELAISVLGQMALFGGTRHDRGEGHPLAGLLILLLGPLAAGLIQAAISRSREFNADKEGAEILGNPMPLATALEKIHIGAERIPLDVSPAFNSLFIAEPRSVFRSMANLFQTHPPLEQRLQNLIGRESTGAFRHAA